MPARHVPLTLAKASAESRGLMRARKNGRFLALAPQDRDLSIKQAVLAELLALGAPKGQAQRLAGYAGSPEGSRAQNEPAVRHRVRELQTTRLARYSALALKVVEKTLTDPAISAKVRLDAAIWTLEAAGHGLRAKKTERKQQTGSLRDLSLDELVEMAKRHRAGTRPAEDVVAAEVGQAIND